jgi:hypothetical protein
MSRISFTAISLVVTSSTLSAPVFLAEQHWWDVPYTAWQALYYSVDVPDGASLVVARFTLDVQSCSDSGMSRMSYMFVGSPPDFWDRAGVF